MLVFLLQHDEAENIGYVIPQPVIEHFISDFERNKKYTAFPLLGIEWQKTENPYLRKALGMKVPSDFLGSLVIGGQSHGICHPKAFLHSCLQQGIVLALSALAVA